MARTTTGIDVGLRSAVVIRGQYKGNTFHVSDFAVEPNEGSGTEDGWKSLEPGFKPTAARIGLTGRDVNLRYVRVPRVPDWQLRKLMRFEVEDIGGQTGEGVASDFNLLPEMPEIEGEDVVVLAMAKESLLTDHLEGLSELGGSLDAFAPNALGLYNAWLRYGVIEGDTVMVANIGHDNIDVVICRGPDIVFARNLSGGSRLFDQAVAQRFGVSEKKAEEVKIEYATLEPNAHHATANHEKASRAILGAAGQLQSLLQSTVLFCKSQLKLSGLKIDRVALCGGGAALSGLPAWLGSTMGVPVELFDPFRVVDTSGLDPETADRLEEYKLESVVALGLATMASDPEAFSVELLPASLRKRREFWGGPAFLIAAGILGLAFLGWDGARQSSELSETKQEVTKRQRELKRVKKVDFDTRELLAQNEQLAEETVELWAYAGAGEQLARTLEVLDRRMPQEFWLSTLSSTWAFDEELGVFRKAERPIVRMEGKARQGTASMAALHGSFQTSMQEGLAGARLKAAPNADGSLFSLDLTLLGEPEEVEGDGAEEDGLASGEED